MNLTLLEETKSELRWIFQLRWAVITIILFAYSTGRVLEYLGQKFYMLIFILALFYGIYNAFIGFLLEEKTKFKKSRPLIELFIDQVFLFTILYLSGGTSNPIIDIISVPLIFSGLILSIHASLLFFIPYTASLIFLNLNYYPLWNENFTHLATHELVGKILFNVLIFSAIHWINYQLKNVQTLVMELNEKENHRKRFDLLGMFSQSFCHKLSTPINTIKMRTDRLVRNESLTQETKEELLQIHFACENSIESLKEFNKLSYSKDTFDEVFELRSFLEELTQAYFHQNELKVEFNSDSELKIKTNKSELTHILYDLFDNSFEANAESVRLSFFTERNKLYLSLIDNGEGISPEVIEFISHEIKTTKIQGMGLGLYHAKSFCQMTGGDLKLLPKEHGLEVILILDVLYDLDR